MVLNIKTKNLDLTPSLSAYINKKIKFLNRFLKAWEEKGALQVDFELAKTTKHHKKGDVYYAEVNLFIGGHKLRAEQKTDDIYKSIDQVKDIIKREVNKYKQKLNIA